MEYRDSTRNMKEIGAELNVGTILEGGVQKVGNRVRINAQLIEVATDRHLWAETFDRELTAENVFELQSEIAHRIVEAVSVELTDEEEELLKEIPTSNLAAYDAYLRGMEIINGANYARTEEEAAFPFFQAAVELDPDYALAHAELAGLYAQLYWRGLDTSENLLNKYRETLDRAIALDPDSPVALRAQANWHYRVENDYHKSLELLQRAIEIAPGDVDIQSDIGLTLRRLGRWDESIDAFFRTLELDPASSFNQALLTETMASSRRWQDVVDNSVSLEDADRDQLDIQLTRAQALYNLTGDLHHFEQVFESMHLVGTTDYLAWSAYIHFLQRDWDKSIEVLENDIWTDLAVMRVGETNRLSQLGDNWRFKGDEDRARQYYEQLVARIDEVMESALQVQIYSGSLIAVALARLGRYEEALALVDRLVEENPVENDALVAITPIYNRAMVRALAGDREGALVDLETALTMPGAIGPNQWDLHYDPNWDFMRDDPRFVELATPDNLIQ
jgi:tetratricopeptide (TPR) repeat protein